MAKFNVWYNGTDGVEHTVSAEADSKEELMNYLKNQGLSNARVEEVIAFNIRNAREWLNVDLPKLEYLSTGTKFDNICGGVTRGAISVMSGYSGNGKSWLLLHLGAALSRKYKVLYISVENAIQADLSRIEQLPFEYGFNDCNFEYENVPYDNISYNEVENNIKKLFAQKQQYDVLIIDGADILMSGDTGSELYQNGNKFMQDLKRISEQNNMAVILSWQLTRESEKKKIEDLGSSDIAQSIGVARYASLMVVIKRYKDENEWKIRAVKERTTDYNAEPISVQGKYGFNLNGGATHFTVANKQVGFQAVSDVELMKEMN